MAAPEVEVGTLVFAAGDQPNQFGSVLLVDRAGHRTPLRDGHGGRPRFHPTRPLIAAGDSGQIWLYDLARGYPEAGETIRVSADGGTHPLWAPSGRELFYLAGGKIMVVSVAGGLVGSPRLLLDLPGLDGDDISWPYDISPDGSTFVVSLASPAPPVHLRAITDIRGKLPPR